MVAQHQQFAESLRNLRESRGFTQTDLAKASGISQSTVSALETGKQRPWPTTRRALAQAFEMSLADFDKAVLPARHPKVPTVEMLANEAISGPDGDVAASYMESMVRLVNQLYLTQERARRSEHELGLIRRFIDDMPMLMWATGMDLRVVSASGWARRRHKDWAELIGRTIPEFQELTSGGIPLPPLEPCQRALEGHAVSTVVIWGEEQWNVAIEPVREARDQVTGVLGLAVLRDIAV